MDQIDLTLLAELEKGLPLKERPFDIIGEALQSSSEEVISRIKKLRDLGVIRRFRARISQRKLGIVANALVAWKIPKQDTEMIGCQLASFNVVTHCYQRRVIPGRWEYSLYTVHHGRSEESVIHEVSLISDKIGYSDYLVLFSTEEYKRTPNVCIRNPGIKE